jgi:SAM-dependent methyltransferase
MPDVSREVLQAQLSQSWLKRTLKARIKRWVGTNNAEVREAWVERKLRELPAGSRLLDAGAGELQYKRFCGHLKYVSQDFGQYTGVGDGSGLQTGTWDNSATDIICDITQIPEPDGSFDAILCIEVLEHLEAPIEALREFTRLLRPGGVLILTAPFASLTHQSPYHFYSGFNRHFYRRWLDRLGFAIEELVPNGNFFDFVCQELGRAGSVARTYTRNQKAFGVLENAARAICLRSLKRLSSRDAGSDELLCFGYLIKAVKGEGA